MNYKAIVFIVALAIGGVGPANGQFLKKLGERAEKAAERTILNRTEREVSKGTDKAIDEALGAGKKGGKDKDAPKEGADSGEAERDEAQANTPSLLSSFMGGGMEDVPDTYRFSYRATMKIITDDEEEMAMQYWLEPDATYFGTKSLIGDNADNLAVMDLENHAMVMFIDDGKQKTAMRIKADQKILDKYTGQSGEDEDAVDVNITPIEGKTILGYRCKGFQVESEDGVSKVWVTDEAPVGMYSGAIQGDYVPEGMPNFGSKALLMEMEYIPNKGKKDHVRMVCTELKPASMVIRKADYQTMGAMGSN